MPEPTMAFAKIYSYAQDGGAAFVWLFGRLFRRLCRVCTLQLFWCLIYGCLGVLEQRRGERCCLLFASSVIIFRRAGGSFIRKKTTETRVNRPQPTLASGV